MRVRPASVQVERLEQPSALNRIPGHNQALHNLEAPTRLLLRPGGAVRGTRREADRAAGVADCAGELPVLRALDHVLDARAVELEVKLGLRGRREILGWEHLDPLEHDLILRVARRLPVVTARVALATGLLRQWFRQEPAARGVRSVYEFRHDVIVGLGLAGGPHPAVRCLRHVRERESQARLPAVAHDTRRASTSVRVATGSHEHRLDVLAVVVEVRGDRGRAVNHRCGRGHFRRGGREANSGENAHPRHEREGGEAHGAVDPAVVSAHRLRLPRSFTRSGGRIATSIRAGRAPVCILATISWVRRSIAIV